MPRREWTVAEVEYLRENAGKISVEEIASNLQRTKRSILNAGKYRGIEFTTKKRMWTQAEVSQLEELAERYCASTAAKKLGRSPSSVKQAAFRYGIKFTRNRMTNKDVAEILNVHIETVRKARDALGLCFRKTSRSTRAVTRYRGATGKDIAAIARYLLSNERSHSSLRVSAKHLRAVIEEWESYE